MIVRRRALIAASLMGLLFATGLKVEIGQAGGSPVKRAIPVVRGVQTVRQAISMCRNHADDGYRIRVHLHGIFLRQQTLSLNYNQGALFDTADVPIGATYNGRIHYYGGIYVSLEPYSHVTPASRPSWVVLAGILHCSGPYLKVHSWRPGIPGPRENIPTLKEQVTPRDALRICQVNAFARYRVKARGYYLGTYSEGFVDGILYGQRVPENAPQQGAAAFGGLTVVPSAAYRATSDIPSRTWVIVTGLLACGAIPEQLKAYTWQRTVEGSNR